MQIIITFAADLKKQLKTFNNKKTKAMKNLKKALLILIVVGMALPACKKGENDPGISLKSRKARLTGEWKLTEGSTTQTSGSTTATYAYNGSTCTVTSGGFSSTDPYTEKIEFLKDGTFEYVITEGADLTTIKGSWYFGGKAKDLDIKNKESVVLLITSEVYTSGGTTSTYTYTGSQIGTYVLYLDKLSNKQIVIIVDGTYTGGSASSQSGTMTYEQ